MSNTQSDHNSARPSRSIAAMLQRWAARFFAPPLAPKGRVLPEELEGAEDWLLQDLGLADPEDDAPPPRLRKP